MSGLQGGRKAILGLAKEPPKIMTELLAKADNIMNAE